jgi:competence protein ComEC
MKWRQFFGSRKVFGAATAALLALATLFFSAWASLPDGRLRLWFLDVGQGDAILARLPAGEWMLVDGGPDAAVLTHLGRLMPFYEREIELMVLTHPHADHVDGLVEVLERYQVHNLLLTGVEYDYAGYKRLLDLARSGGVNLNYSSDGLDYAIGPTALDLLYPGAALRGRGIDNVNNSSLVFRLVFGGWRGLFSGDLEEEKEAELLAGDGQTAGGSRVEGEPDLSADLLKAGHHGSKTSNSPDFVRAIGPSEAIISCGAGNSFGHPSPQTLETFRQAGVTVKRTDLDGTIERSI